MSWRETWRATVESFLRGVRDPVDPTGDHAVDDPVATAIALARAEVREVERSLEYARLRVAAEAESLALCERRRAQAERIGDAETARVAQRFAARHTDRLGVLHRKCAVLEDELRLARTTLTEVLDLARADANEIRADPAR